ncbi:MAG: glycerophosphodiester phosphodiesterase [Bdellovibrionaceae bacterium]|nr:glycerophosphodiester phosphodiesterase [Pseudobdellovibrionaceae bacterium]
MIIAKWFKSRNVGALLGLVGVLTVAGCVSTTESSRATEEVQTQSPRRPLVIAHRGASGYLPEHTLEAYIRGMEMGADFVEPDLVMTKDGVLVARHENEISDTTNVASVFPDRKTTKVIEDAKVTGWFVEDFTLAEVKKLKAKQRLAFRPQMDQQAFLVPTLAEIIDAVDQYNTKHGKKIGIIPEIKHSTYFRSVGLNIEKELLRVLAEKTWSQKLDQVYIQSFEVGNLRELAATTKYSLVQLLGDPKESPYDLKSKKITYRDMVTNEGLREIRKYAMALGPYKKYLVVENNAKDDSLVANDVLKNARLLDFRIFPYTFRNESFFILKPLTDPMKEYEFFYKLGVDGVFSDFPDTAVKALKAVESVLN